MNAGRARAEVDADQRLGVVGVDGVGAAGPSAAAASGCAAAVLEALERSAD